MKFALYLVASLALLAVLARMMFTGAWRLRPRLFLFLTAWYVYSAACFFFPPAWVHFLPWLFLAPEVARALRTAAPEADLGAVLIIALCGACICSTETFRAWGDAVAPFNAVCWLAISASVVFFFAAARMSPACHPEERVRQVKGRTSDEGPQGFDFSESLDRRAWLALAAFFLLYGAGQQIAAALEARPLQDLVVLATAGVWLVFAASFGPRADALIAPERLAWLPVLKSQISNVRSAFFGRPA